MKKLVIMLVALVLLMAFPAAAGAKKPPLTGETCAERIFDDPLLWQVASAGDDFPVYLTPEQPAACIDVTSLEGVWEFEVVDADGVASFNMQIKDSVPGDMCWRDAWTNKKASLPYLLNTPEAIPPATINACPGDDFTDDADSLVFMVAYGPERGTTAGNLTVCVDLPPFDNFEFCPED